MTCVCHRCGMDLAPANCLVCKGPCQQFSCSHCKGHYCHACLAVHLSENWCGEKGQLRLRQPAA